MKYVQLPEWMWRKSKKQESADMKHISPEIKFLCDHMSYSDTVADWIFHAFIKDIKKDRTYEDVLASTKTCYRDKLPIRLVAFSEEKCIGTVSIFENDLACRNYTPWLAALYVDKAHRNLGVGKALITYVKELARELGYKELYLRTEEANQYYAKLGWTYIETCEDKYNIVPDVFKVEL